MDADRGPLPTIHSQLFEERNNVQSIALSELVATTSQTYETTVLDEAMRAVQGLPAFRELVSRLSRVS